VFRGWVGAIAVSVVDDAGADSNSCSIRAMDCTDGSLLMSGGDMFVLGWSPGRVSWVMGVVSMVESVCDEISGWGCAMGVGGGVVDRGLVSLDPSAT